MSEYGEAGICWHRDCNEPRLRYSTGNYATRCVKHQRAAESAAKKRRRAKAKAVNGEQS
jgi:hypothetical protein